jgi:hypothetical protein
MAKQAKNTPSRKPATVGEQSVYQAYILDLLTEETRVISQAIIERNHQSTLIKKWCVALWIAVWGILSVEFVIKGFEGYEHYLLLAPAIFPPAFLFLDIINKRIERKLTFRVRQIHGFLNGDVGAGGAGDSPLARFIETGDLSDFRVYDPAAMNWYYGSDPDPRQKAELAKLMTFWNIFCGAWGLDFFYLYLMAWPLLAFFLFPFLPAAP